MTGFTKFINQLTMQKLTRINGIGNTLATRFIITKDTKGIKSTNDIFSIKGFNKTKTKIIDNEYKNYKLIQQLKENKNSIIYK